MGNFPFVKGSKCLAATQSSQWPGDIQDGWEARVRKIPFLAVVTMDSFSVVNNINVVGNS